MDNSSLGLTIQEGQCQNRRKGTISVKKRGKGKKMELDEQKKSWVLRSLEIEIRKQHRSITKLAQEMGAKPSWLYRILRGERGMDLFDFLKLTEVLGVSPREILKDYPPPPVVPGQELSADKLADLLSQIIPEEVLTILVNMKKPQN